MIYIADTHRSGEGNKGWVAFRAG